MVPVLNHEISEGANDPAQVNLYSGSKSHCKNIDHCQALHQIHCGRVLFSCCRVTENTVMKICIVTEIGKLFAFGLFSALLSGCGGGGGGGDSEPSPQNNPAPGTGSDTGFTINHGNLSMVAVTAMGSIESLVQMGHWAVESGRDSIFRQDLNTTLTCTNGGERTLTLIDNDNSDELSQGDRIEINYQGCEDESFQDSLSGTAILDINELDIDEPNRQLTSATFTVNLNDLFISTSKLQILEAFRVAFQRTASEQSITVMQLSNPTRVVAEGITTLHLSDYAITKSLDTATARYSVTGRIMVAMDAPGVEALDNARFSVVFVVPFKNYFGQEPVIGEVDVIAENGQLSLRVNSIENTLDIYQNNLFKARGEWTDIMEGVFSWYPGVFPMDNNQYYGHNSFDNLGSMSENLYQGMISPLGPVQLLFNRPVEKVTSNFLQFNSESYTDNDIDALVEVDGAIVSITPSEPLIPGKKYNINHLEVRSIDGDDLYTGIYSAFRVSDALVPIITASKKSLNDENDQIILSGDGSIFNRGSEITYLWEELTDFGIVFSSPDTAETSLSLPDHDEAAKVKVRLTIKNEFFDIASADTELFKIGTDTFSLLFIESENDEASRQEPTVLLSEDDGSFIVTPTFESKRNSIKLQFQGEDYWYFAFSAPQGEDLTIGQYIEANVYSITDPLKPSINTYLPESECDQSGGEFEIRELDFGDDDTVDVLALDFTLFCDDDASRRNGNIRFNSREPL